MKNVFVKKPNEKGMISMIMMLFVSAVVLTISVSVASLAMGEMKMAKNGVASVEKTFYIAESGLNIALYRLFSDPSPGSYTIDVDGVEVAVEVLLNPGESYQRIVRVKATTPDNKVRRVQAIVDTDSFGVALDYAVQGGDGGITMENNSVIEGDVYSNGNIVAENNSYIQGEVWAAENHMLEGADVSENVHVYEIIDSLIGGDAYYNIIDTDTEVTGALHPGASELDTEDFPITDEDIENWKSEIVDEVGANSSECPESYDAGYYCIMSDTVLETTKIVGTSSEPIGLYLDGDSQLILGGNLWVTGDIIFDNNGVDGVVKAKEELGGASVAIISDGKVDIGNNFGIEGSGDERSYVLLISTNDSLDVGSPAIYASNNSDSIIFGAPHGVLKVKNNGEVNAAFSKELYLEQNSKVIFNNSLSAFSVVSSDENFINVVDWQEL